MKPNTPSIIPADMNSAHQTSVFGSFGKKSKRDSPARNAANNNRKGTTLDERGKELEQKLDQPSEE